jgi:hypothetical protein
MFASCEQLNRCDSRQSLSSPACSTSSPLEPIYERYENPLTTRKLSLSNETNSIHSASTFTYEKPSELRRVGSERKYRSTLDEPRFNGFVSKEWIKNELLVQFHQKYSSHNLACQRTSVGFILLHFPFLLASGFD